MRRYGILGHPLTHTMSPFLHHRLFRLSGTEAEYRVFDLAPDALGAKKEELLSLDGFNVTIPYKIDVISMADKLSEEAERFRSVNCFKNEGGVSEGYNTDVDGFVRAVEELGGNLGGRVLLLGAGGVAQTMAVTAVLGGAELTIAARASDREAAETLAARASRYGKAVKTTDLSKIDGKFDLLINATPVGMYPNVNASPVGEEVVRRVGAVFDAVYNPKKTLLFKTARQLKIPAATGMSMLVYQAVKAHEIWYGAKFRKEDILKLIADASAYTEEHFR